MRYVIIGNSAAAVGCIESIRRLDSDGEIIIVSSEPQHTYARPLISYLLLGKTDRERMKYRPASFYEDNRCQVYFGYTATQLLPEQKQVRIEKTAGAAASLLNVEQAEAEKTLLSYDKLLVATGSRPFVPPMAGLETIEKKFTFLSLDDAEALEAALTPNARVLIIGAGLIGLKCAEGIAARVGSITVVDMADRILPSILDEAGAKRVQTHLEAQGLTFYLKDSAAELCAEQGAYTAVLKSGVRLPFDLLVVAVGVRPNTELLAQAGGEVGRGILTKPTGETSLPDIYAAGDCTESFDLSIGESRILALLPNAYLQGETAGANMTGKTEAVTFDKAIPMNAIGFMGLYIVTAGSYLGECYKEETDTLYKELYSQDNMLKGYILIGDVARAGIYTALIRNQTPLDTLDFALIRQKPQLMAFQKKERAALLGTKRV